MSYELFWIKEMISIVENPDSLVIAVGIANFFAEKVKDKGISLNESKNISSSGGQVLNIVDVLNYMSKQDTTSHVIAIDPAFEKEDVVKRTFNYNILKKQLYGSYTYYTYAQNRRTINFYPYPKQIPSRFPKSKNSFLTILDASKLKPYDMAEKCKILKRTEYSHIYNIATNINFKKIFIMNDAWIRTIGFKEYYVNKYFENMCELFYILKYCGDNKDKYVIDVSFTDTHRGQIFKNQPIYKIKDYASDPSWVYGFNENLEFSRNYSGKKSMEEIEDYYRSGAWATKEFNLEQLQREANVNKNPVWYDKKQFSQYISKLPPNEKEMMLRFFNLEERKRRLHSFSRSKNEKSVLHEILTRLPTKKEGGLLLFPPDKDYTNTIIPLMNIFNKLPKTSIPKDEKGNVNVKKTVDMLEAKRQESMIAQSALGAGAGIAQSALGAGAGDESRGGKRRTITRKQKKRSRKYKR